MNLNSNESNSIARFNFRDLMIILVPILIFVLYYFVYNPGVLTVASFSQLHQIATGQFTTAHPILHTLLEMLCIKILGTPFYIGLIQIVIFSVMWMIICKYHRDDSLKNSNEFLVQFIITLLICLIPINAVYSITLSSNILFCYSIMFLCFLIKVMVDKNGQIDGKVLILMALTMGIMSGLNNYGIIIALPTLIAVAYYLMKKGTSENKFVMFLGLAVLCIFLVASLNFVYDVQKDKFHIPTDDAFENDIDIKNAQNQFFAIINGEPSESYENVVQPAGKSSYNIIDSFVDMWRENQILNILFSNPILYLILSILILAFIYIKTGSNEIFLVYLPGFLNTIIFVLTGSNPYGNVLVFYLIVIIGLSFFFKPNLMKEYSNRPQTIARPERIQTPPPAQVEETYEDENYYSYLESQIDELTLDEVNEMLGERTVEKETPKVEQPAPQGDSDLIESILKEMERDNK